MSPLFVILLTLCSNVEVTIAPDQPFPYVYEDDPLIIEFLSDVETDIDAKLTLQASHIDEQQAIALGNMHLYANSGYWYAVHDAPRARGFYVAEITITSGGSSSSSQKSFCRIDRPASLNQIPVYAYCDSQENACPFPVIHSVGIDTFRCDMDNGHLADILSNVGLFDSNLIVAMPIERAKAFSDSDVTAIQSQCDNIIRLDMSLNTSTASAADINDIMRRIGCPAGISLVVPNATVFKEQLTQYHNLTLRHATLMTYDWPDLSEITSIKRSALELGQEGWQIHVLCPAWQPRNNDEILQFIQRFLQYRSINVSYIGVNAGTLVKDTDVQELMAYLNGLALRFDSTAFIGQITASSNIQTPVFRNDSKWFAALWSKNSNEQISIPVAGAVSLQLSDALGNDIPLPEIVNEQITLSLGASPLYLTGTGGVVLGQAALQELSKTAESVTASETMKAALTPAVVGLIEKIANEPQGSGCRLRFFDLLRVFPRLEEDWHTKKLLPEQAIPAIALVAKLARLLCIVEEDRGERFIEPISDTIGRAAELQSLYLTGSAGSAQARKRGDWVLGEVLRLIDEAETLEQAGRKIEASAVAAIAEWRAHCLVYAAQAEQVPSAIPEVQPLVLPKPETQDSPNGEDKSETAENVSTTNNEEEIEQTVQSPQQPKIKDNEKTAASSTAFHTVKSGDSFYIIAKKYNISIDDLLKWNKLKKNSILRVGQKLRIAADENTQDSTTEKPEEIQEENKGSLESNKTDETEETVKDSEENKKSAAKETTHIVKSGDNPYTIAKKYNVSLDDFLKWNNLKKNSVLHIGQKLIIHADN